MLCSCGTTLTYDKIHKARYRLKNDYIAFYWDAYPAEKERYYRDDFRYRAMNTILDSLKVLDGKTNFVIVNNVCDMEGSQVFHNWIFCDGHKFAISYERKDSVSGNRIIRTDYVPQVSNVRMKESDSLTWDIPERLYRYLAREWTYEENPFRNLAPDAFNLHRYEVTVVKGKKISFFIAERMPMIRREF